MEGLYWILGVSAITVAVLCTIKFKDTLRTAWSSAWAIKAAKSQRITPETRRRLLSQLDEEK